MLSMHAGFPLLPSSPLPPPRGKFLFLLTILTILATIFILNWHSHTAKDVLTSSFSSFFAPLAHLASINFCGIVNHIVGIGKRTIPLLQQCRPRSSVTVSHRSSLRIEMATNLLFWHILFR